MRAPHLVTPAAALVITLALAARPGGARADDAGQALASRPFSLGAVSIDRWAGAALRIGKFPCMCLGTTGDFTGAAWELRAELPLSRRAALFVLQPILLRFPPEGGASSHQFPGALTAGVRHLAAPGAGLALAAAASVSLPYPDAGGEAMGTTAMAGLMVADRSLYTSAQGAIRLELDARWQRSILFAQAQLALAAYSGASELTGDSRGGVAAGVELPGRIALLGELTQELGGPTLYCVVCDARWHGPGRATVSLGGSVALGAWVVGARGFWPLADSDEWGAAPSLAVTAGARL